MSKSYILRFSVTVAKRAPPDAPVKPVEYGSVAGPRFDDDGYVVPHSILGTVEEFKAEARRRGELPKVCHLILYRFPFSKKIN